MHYHEITEGLTTPAEKWIRDAVVISNEFQCPIETKIIDDSTVSYALTPHPKFPQYMTACTTDLNQLSDIYNVTSNDYHPKPPRRKAIHFINEVNRYLGENNLLRDIKLELARKNSRTVHIHWIAATEQGNGVGSKVMNGICALADKFQIILTGDCVSERVANWMTRYGFVIGRPEEVDIDDFMFPVRRLPKVTSS